MNKLIKFLALVGLTSAVSYLVFGLKGKSSANDHNSHKQSRNGNPKTSHSQKGTKIENADYTNSRTQKMYKDLSMTEEQQRRYEHDYQTVMGTWKKNNPNYDMYDQEKIEEHNSLLSAVLNEAQYSMYREWFKNNPA
ncbi:hypothetical protein EV196_102411 [Mariniflexile fucanivorans]|uniref:Uncharacterized protein n=1 Tax=Mariniflexile fucanivorans TaxID=264023 RepID=A0A4R1RNG6_9FLAO|nr:hypothetical protein [Mariniflexile fucanivorans]TCL67848.1 hypothetical protein EV196_102411 [Mariniflexile fucanivorans]